MYFSDDYFDNVMKVITRDGRRYVLTGDSALYYNGASVTINFTPFVLSDMFKGIQVVRLRGYVHYCYINEKPDTENYVTPYENCPNILIPTYERAFIECIKYNMEFCDEGNFCDSLCRYLTFAHGDYSKLYGVADFYNVPRSEVDYWIKESEDFI